MPTYFIELANNRLFPQKYLKITLYGMTSGAPDAVILMVGANAGLIGMSKEHLAIALALGVPVCVVISKVSHPLEFASQMRCQRDGRST